MKSFSNLSAKTFRAIFIIALMFSFSVAAKAQVFTYTTPIVEKDGLSYDISTGNARLWHSDTENVSKVNIPSQLDKNGHHYKVTEMRKSTFKNCKNVTTIYVPATINDIQPNAIYNCPNLETIILPEKFKGIDINKIATKCPKLTKVIYSNTVI